MNLTRPQLRIVLAATEDAVATTLELIDCYHNHGRCINPPFVAKQRRYIAGLKKLRKAIQEHLAAQKAKGNATGG